MVGQVGSLGLKYFAERPIDAVRFIKAVSFDWAAHFGYLPKSLDKCYSLTILLDEFASVKDFLDVTKDFITSIDSLDKFLSLNMNDILKGDQAVIRNGINCVSDALSLVAVFASKFGRLSGVTVNYLEIASSLISITKDLQDLYRILIQQENEGQQGVAEVSISVIRNSLSISRSLVEASVRQYLLLTCGSAYSITKLALFILDNKK